MTRDVTTRADKVRQERKRITLSVLRVREKHEKGAKEVRSLSIDNEENIKQGRTIEKFHKRELVEKVHQCMEKSKSVQHQRQAELEERAKKEHQAQLEERLRANEAKRVRHSLCRDATVFCVRSCRTPCWRVVRSGRSAKPSCGSTAPSAVTNLIFRPAASSRRFRALPADFLFPISIATGIINRWLL
jgi:hypothetical protein